jgi:hypothetical protein
MLGRAGPPQTAAISATRPCHRKNPLLIFGVIEKFMDIPLKDQYIDCENPCRGKNASALLEKETAKPKEQHQNPDPRLSRSDFHGSTIKETVVSWPPGDTRKQPCQKARHKDSELFSGWTFNKGAARARRSGNSH